MESNRKCKVVGKGGYRKKMAMRCRLRPGWEGEGRKGGGHLRLW